MSKIFYLLLVVMHVRAHCMEPHEIDPLDSLEFIGVIDMLDQSSMADDTNTIELVAINKQQFNLFIENFVRITQKYNQLLAAHKKQ